MKKLYYSIGEVSERTGVETHVLRYWESIFPQLNPTKNRAGKRLYNEGHIDIALKLKELIKDKKFSTAGALRALGNKPKDEIEAIEDGLPVDLKRDLSEIKILLQRIYEQL